jgi:hypothetical protein
MTALQLCLDVHSEIVVGNFAGGNPVDRRVGRQYRLLVRGDRIERDDEFLQDDCDSWATDPLHIFVGMEYLPVALKPARRLKTPNVEVRDDRRPYRPESSAEGAISTAGLGCTGKGTICCR